MKSGIVIEVNNKKATLLMKDGTFITVNIPKGKRPLVGNEYQASYFSNRKRSLIVLPSLSLSVASLVAFMFLSGMMPFGNQAAAAAYVSFDINPSLEVGVDDEMQVVEIDAYNTEAQKIIKKYKLSTDEHLSIEQFADQLIQAYEKEGYMNSDHSMLITTVSSEEGNEKTEKALDQAVDSIVKKTVVKYPVAITVTETNPQTREKAKQMGVSSGKYTAFEKANQSGKSVEKAKVKEADIQELRTKAVPTSSDIKVVPHPRKINTTHHEINTFGASTFIKKEGHQDQKVNDHLKNQNKKLLKMEKPSKEIKVKDESFKMSKKSVHMEKMHQRFPKDKHHVHKARTQKGNQKHEGKNIQKQEHKNEHKH